ncbi:MAG: glycoside hydrolase family 88 protein [Polyangiaceae bacterium]
MPLKEEVLLAMRRANEYWIQNHGSPGDRGWARATYFEGNMAMHRVYPDEMYLNYTLKWAEGHSWSLYQGAATRHADNQNIGQTYIDLYRMSPDEQRIDMIEDSISGMLATDQVDDWWWVDALHMAMPVFARLAVVRSDPAYSERLYEMYDWTKRREGGDGLWNPDESLWWRDASFKPPAASPNGENLYWSRGNGWAIAAHARTIEELDRLPSEDPHRAEYVDTFQRMAAALAELQQSDGFWSANLLDSGNPAGPETSGTAFFTYAMAWGVNHGLLSRRTYLPIIEEAWSALVDVALADDGKLGYIQPVGAAPISRSTNPGDHYDFGVGAFLLAGSEVIKLSRGHLPPLLTDENLALGGVVVATSEQVGNEARGAVDNDLTTRWSAFGYPQSLELDLLGVERIRGIELAPLSQRPYQFIVETRASSSDPWTVAVDATDNTEHAPFHTRLFSPRDARFVRLTVTGLDGSAAYSDWISVIEFRVFEDEFENRNRCRR